MPCMVPSEQEAGAASIGQLGRRVLELVQGVKIESVCGIRIFLGS
jgi:hypothetical protein